MKQTIPFLRFNGDCREAMEFYKKCFGAELFLMTFSETPGNPFPGGGDRIMHSSLSNGSTFLAASDTLPDTPVKEGNDFSVLMECESTEEIDAFFAALSEDGTFIMPLQETFWAARFGMLVDQFGVQWMLNYSIPANALMDL